MDHEARTRHRWTWIALLAVTACAHAPRPRPGRPGTDVAYLRERKIMVPVEGITVAKVPDTFRAKRGARAHNAIDFMAAKGTPVLAADDGQILKLGENPAGGITIYAIDSRSRLVYYYAHLDRYRRGLDEGDKVKKGEVIGYVGYTGNASERFPHLHFQIMRWDHANRWWDGTPIDPKPVLALDGVRKKK